MGLLRERGAQAGTSLSLDYFAAPFDLQILSLQSKLKHDARRCARSEPQRPGDLSKRHLSP